MRHFSKLNFRPQSVTMLVAFFLKVVEMKVEIQQVLANGAPCENGSSGTTTICQPGEQ